MEFSNQSRPRTAINIIFSEELNKASAAITVNGVTDIITYDKQHSYVHTVFSVQGQHRYTVIANDIRQAMS